MQRVNEPLQGFCYFFFVFFDLVFYWFIHEMKQKSRVCDQSREIASLNPSFSFHWTHTNSDKKKP